KADDIAGITDLYPEADFTRTAGSISGRVTKDGQPVFGAHVVAFNVDTGRLVGSFSLGTQGEFSVASLAAGVYVLRVEPLDDAETDSFFDPSPTIDLDFRVTFADRAVVVPSGGDSGEISVKVARKYV